MKLDRLKFATLIGYITYMLDNRTLSQTEVAELDAICDVDVTPVEIPGKANAAVDALMKAIHEGKKIEAIKAHRMLTGYGLKESKDAVEKYWNYKYTKEDMFNKAAMRSMTIPDASAVHNFIKEEFA